MTPTQNPVRCSSMIIGQGGLLMECAQEWLACGNRITAIVSDDSSVRAWAEARGIRRLFTSDDALVVAKEEPFDYLFSIINYAVLPKELLMMPRVAAVNYHDAPLPRYAGLYATSWALVAQEQSWAISWHKMNHQIDGGDVYKQRTVEVASGDTAFSLNGKCYAAGIEAFKELVGEIGQGCARAIPQDLRERTYFGKYARPAVACLLDWTKTAAELEALVRALDFGVYPNPLGIAKMLCRDHVFLISKAIAGRSTGNPSPGTVTRLDENIMGVATTAGELQILQLLTADGTPLNIADVSKRCGLNVGDTLPMKGLEAASYLTDLNRKVCRHEEFWLQRLAQLQPYVLPLERRPKTGQVKGVSEVSTLALPENVHQMLDADVSGKADFLVCGFYAFLARIGYPSAFDVGLRVENLSTNRKEAESLFSAYVPVRIDAELSREATLLLTLSRERIEEARKHLTYSRDLVVRYPHLRSVAALRQENKLPVVAEISESKAPYRRSPGIELAFVVTPDGSECKWIYDPSVFDSDVISRASKHFCTFLSALVSDPTQPVEKLALLTSSDRHHLISDFNVPADAPCSNNLPMDGCATLHGLFEVQAVRRPESVALKCDGESLTYQELNTRANQVARELVTWGVKPDALVGLCLDRSNELVIAILAVLKAGGAYLPIDLAYPADRLAFMLEDAQAPVLLTQAKLSSKLPATAAKVLYIDEILARPAQTVDAENLPSVVGPDHLAYVIYTSGTTGKPKGSLITHRNAVRLFSATEHWYGFNERDVWTLFHSSAFDFSVWEIWGAFLYGGRVLVVPFMVSRSPEAFYELLSREQVTVLNQTPSAFRQLIQAEGSVGQKQLALRYVIFGGEALEMQSLRPWFERHGDHTPRLVNMYGITETTVHVTYRSLSKDDLASGSVIGVPLPDLQVYILDAQRQPVPIGVPGEMYVGGAGLARGYLRRPELTAERFVPDHLTGRANSRLYKTGDLARFLPGRDIEYLGRIDDQVKIRGFRIELGEIESVLCQHPAVREAVVMAREDVPGAKRLAAYLSTSQPAPEIGELREHLKQRLPEYMVPAVFIFLERLPLTNNGKIDRKALPAPEQQRPDFAGRYAAPCTPAEKALAAIWSKVLRVKQIGINDNFFELGGDSILSIQIISAARREGLMLTPKLLFAHQTIAALAAAAEITECRPAIQEEVAGRVPFTPIQEWFFEQNLEEPMHYNQAFLFEVTEPMDRSLLESALQQVNRHHDALRMRYVREGEVWRQFVSSSEQSSFLDWINLADLSEVEQRQSMEKAAGFAQARLDLQNGPLWCVNYFDFGSGRAGRLLVVVHHLAIDGISWRPLLEDIETAYLQLEAGQAVALQPKTTSYKSWAERLLEIAASGSLQSELPYWKNLIDSSQAEADKKYFPGDSAASTEGSARLLKSELTASETQALLQQVPAVYNTQINDVLLTALAKAWSELTGSRELFTNLEGHGRENLFEDADLSRTVGWFTSIYPVRLQLPETRTAWHPGDALKSVKEQLRQIPVRGVGYGILKYLNRESSLANGVEPAMVFNYLGQFDQVVADSRLFRFAAESSGPWHSPRQRRRHALEINCQIRGGQLELCWTYNSGAQSEAVIPQFAEGFLAALRELILHCQTPKAGGRTPSDFPLARLSQATLDQLVTDRRDIEDIYPLSPIQTLFYSANPGAAQLAFDQWQCTLHGKLDVSAFQLAWLETLQRHTVLRSTIHSEGLREPMQVVHRQVQPLWTIEDWRMSSSAQHAERWASFLKEDRAQPLALTKAPVMRFSLVRLDEGTWKFLWSVPALLLDGWSWPLVFRDASRLYESLAHSHLPELDPVRPYRDYLEWLGSQSPDEALSFWREALAGFHEPTPLLGESPDHSESGQRYVEHVVRLSAETTNALHSSARMLQSTLSTLVQGCWALLISRQAQRSDVVFGAAFAGRPADLRGVEAIVGPFVNNVPIRTTVNLELTVGEFLRQLHTSLLRSNAFQYSPLMEIQRASEVPWRHRLFDSLVVFQNYLVDPSARRFGAQIHIEDFVDPIHTNYPIMLLAEPGTELRLTLIYDRESLARGTVERWGRDLAVLLERLPRFTEQPVADLQELLSQPVTVGPRAKTKLRAQSQDCLPPQTEMERAIAGIWQGLFGVEQVSVEENLFDLGGHSLLLVQMHRRLRETLKKEFPLVALFQYPTVRQLARHLDQPATSVAKADERWQERGQRQKRALAELRLTFRK